MVLIFKYLKLKWIYISLLFSSDSYIIQNNTLPFIKCSEKIKTSSFLSMAMLK